MSKTLEIKFKVSDGGGFRTVEANVEDVANAIDKATQANEKLAKTIANNASLAMSFGMLKSAIDTLSDSMGSLTDAYAIQETNEARLAQVMRNTMGASAAQIQSIKDLCSAQQELGVVGDEVQLQAAQELGTYLEQVDTFQTLIPVINDMAAQQLGLGASGESVAQIATMVGKVMQGQTAALSRYGYSFTEAQEAVLKFGTESERAAVLADVIGQSVGGMNAAMAQTDSGRMQQLKNTLGTSTVGMILRAAHAINPREPKRMPPETRAKVMTMLEEGRKVKEISEMLGIAYQTIYSCATRGGYKDSVAHTRHAPEVKAQAIALCRELHSVTKAARAMGLSKYTVYDWVRYSDEEFV